jgi:hypothetical protein
MRPGKGVNAITDVPEMRTEIDRLATLARVLLPSMHDERTGLYLQKVLWTKDGPHALGSNRLYSAISAIGISRDNDDGDPIRLPVTALDSLHALAVRGPSTTGELAATVWALAETGDNRTEELLGLLMSRLKPSASTTMELGLVLAALAAAIDASASVDAVAPSATAASNELLKRFSNSTHLFRGSAWALRPKRKLQWRMTSFASQVYPILGLTEFGRATGTSPPLEAVNAADRLVDLQGPLGQWWWIYSPKAGAVVEGYPVYSVHQHAMALMALAPLENLGLRSYRSELARGVQWLFGDNELNTSLVNFEQGLIARCIQRRGADADGPLGMSRSQWCEVVLSSWGLGFHRPDPVDEHLEVLWESRPYELGWLLYARSLISDW